MQKKLYLCAALIAASLTTFAQEKKNYGLLGVGFNAIDTQQPNPNNSTTQKVFNVNIGYARFLKPGFSLGLKAGYNFSKIEYDEIPEGNTSSWDVTATPFIRYDYQLWKSPFSIFNEIGVTTRFGDMTSDNVNNRTSRFGVQAYYEPGILAHITKQVAMQLSLGSLVSLGYNQERNDDIDYKLNHTYAGITSTYFGTDNLRFAVNYLF